MANKRHKPEEIITKLRQVEVLVGQGGLISLVRADAAEIHEFSIGILGLIQIMDKLRKYQASKAARNVAILLWGGGLGVRSWTCKNPLDD